MLFAAVPELPTSGVREWEIPFLSAMKENIELLTGTRGGSLTSSMAVVRGSVTVKPLGNQQLGSVTRADVDGYTISGSDVAALAAFRTLREDVQTLANDLYYTRQAFDKLLQNMTGG